VARISGRLNPISLPTAYRSAERGSNGVLPSPVLARSQGPRLTSRSPVSDEQGRAVDQVLARLQTESGLTLI